jgi:glyoxylase-like metal-dependent hydrolase (beta-lactamase superfamily II)
MRLGALELQIVPDKSFRLDGGAMFGVVPKVLWEKKAKPDEGNRIPAATNCLLVKGPDFVLVVDAGLGDKWEPKAREMYAVDPGAALPTSLARYGVERGDVDAVILSHLHWDHCGAATEVQAGRIVPAFPNASVYVQETELEHARAPHERDRASYRSENWEPLAAAGRLEAIAGEKEIRPGVTVVPVRGHNEGMQAVRIDSEGETAFFFSDARSRPRPMSRWPGPWPSTSIPST